MQTIFYQELYKVHSTGQIGRWTITVAQDRTIAHMVISSEKVVGGKAVETPTTYREGKNIGRANETTAIEQALSEAASKVKKQIDKGYVETKPEAGAKATNGLGFIKPMLAQPIDKVKDWNFPVYVQPKFDGHRMLATVKDGQVVLYSRQGKVVDVEHVRSELQQMHDSGLWEGATLDGEIYAHGETLQRISSLVKKPKPESKELVYHLYDIDIDDCYTHRLDKIKTFVENRAVPHLVVTSTSIAVDDFALDLLHSEHIGAGYEGTIVRQKGIGYEADKRSKSLMKKKDFQDAEFEIIGVEKGKRNERQNLEVGIYQCRTAAGDEFSVTAPGDAQEKHIHAIEGSRNIGRMLTVKFFNYTPDGIPFHPVALRVRDDI